LRTSSRKTTIAHFVPRARFDVGRSDIAAADLREIRALAAGDQDAKRHRAEQI
jgi:hypothetical protein